MPAYGELIPASEVGDPFRPDVFVVDKDFQNPRTFAAAASYEREFGEGLSLLFKYNYAKSEHLTRFVNRNDPLLGSPWLTGLAPDGSNGSQPPDGGGVLRPEPLPGLYLRAHQEVGGHVLEFQGYYTYSEDKSDDDNERDPFSFRYARVTDLDAEWGYSDRHQPNRVNAWLLWQAPFEFNVNLRYSYRSAQPLSLTETGAIAQTPQDRINADGTIMERNTGKKDNKFSSLDLRVSRAFQIGGVEVQAILDAFNLTNETNFRTPAVTNLIFNFDGTVTSGVGDPRQFQLGVRVAF